MQRLGPKKKKKEKEKEMHEVWTVLVGWTENGLYTGEYGWLRADLQRSQTVTKKISSLILICDAKTRFLRKKKRKILWIVLATGLSLYAEQRVDFVKEMGV